MAKTRYNISSILLLIIAFGTLIFFVVCAIYFYNSMIQRFPSKTESTILFWISIFLIILMAIVAVYAIIEFKHKDTNICSTCKNVEVTPSSGCYNDNITSTYKNVQLTSSPVSSPDEITEFDFNTQPIYQPVSQPIYQPVSQTIYQPVSQTIYQPAYQSESQMIISPSNSSEFMSQAHSNNPYSV